MGLQARLSELEAHFCTSESSDAMPGRRARLPVWPSISTNTSWQQPSSQLPRMVGCWFAGNIVQTKC